MHESFFGTVHGMWRDRLLQRLGNHLIERIDPQPMIAFWSSIRHSRLYVDSWVHNFKLHLVSGTGRVGRADK
jgi:hypothetical protein